MQAISRFLDEDGALRQCEQYYPTGNSKPINIHSSDDGSIGFTVSGVWVHEPFGEPNCRWVYLLRQRLFLGHVLPRASWLDGTSLRRMMGVRSELLRHNAHLANGMNEKMIPVTYGYIRVSEAEALDKNLRTQEMELFAYGIRQELMFADDASGGSFDRPGWTALMARVCPGDTIAVAFFDRFARNFYEGVMIQKELAGRRINIVAIREGINTSDDSAGGKFYRRIMLANGQYWQDTTSERVRSGKKRAKAEGKHIDRLPALDANQVNWARRMAAEQESFRSIARALGKSPTTVMRAVLGIGAYGE